MGYEVNVTRALVAGEGGWYPILRSEVDELVNGEADLVIDHRSIGWGSENLWFRDGALSANRPSDGLLRRMIELAARLDAWVIGDDGELYEWDGEQIVSRPQAPAWNSRYLTRGTSAAGLNYKAPIHPDEWAALAAGQSDFAMMTTIVAMLPSGVRRIACPPIPCWTGHPSGEPIPFFFDEDLIEVRRADAPTVDRMAALATVLGARVVDDDDQPA
ncbi:hypothetical protein [Actinoplanes friuliensis]|uniref:Uncharacterized protein n=1 Tax=Actinoplanes friuliensis DSM 7358 TaxID=1246995 RepID=U5VY52_9ACTN|nr:hypothetical protein [Actinoplanes friuliensis]AGZ40635.1 hypothetical protein AFR_11730 [Actinoplanes friuliensis DSM 7358]